MDRNQGGGPNQPRRSQALGSGFVISEDGYIVTNNHVIEGADQVTIEFFSGIELDAQIVGTDPNTDIALLKVESDTALPYVTFGDSNTARVGDYVIVHVGFAISQVDENEAQRVFEYLKEMDELAELEEG